MSEKLLSVDELNALGRVVGDLEAQREILRQACKDMLDLLGMSEVEFKICNGGRGNLGEHSMYNRIINQAKSALRATNDTTAQLAAIASAAPLTPDQLDRLTKSNK